MLKRDDVVRAAFLGPQHPAEELAPDGRGQQQSHQRDGRAAKQGEGEQQRNGRPEPGQERLQKAAGAAQDVGHSRVAGQQAGGEDGKRRDDPPA
ncbi:hypothetical protein ABZ611_17080 [Streptomyces sp. NPDC007861]|uniref:hypothetical protein n=1 Tax=Streptomyces sp. NPDC007861 TaxID=3154893 RepID=UPI0033EB4EB8